MRSPPHRGLVVGLLVAATSMEPRGVARADGNPGAEDVADACFAAAERAQPLLRQKKLREARALLEVCSRDGCPRVARSDCREWLAEATDAQPSIIIAAHEVRGSGGARQMRDVAAARAVIDDSLVIERVDGTPIVVDPGRHRLRLERAGAPALSQDIDVRDGEKARIVDVTWVVAPTSPPARPVPASAYIAGVVGLAAIGVGTYFEISGLSQRSALDGSCKTTATCSEGDVDSARSRLRIGDAAIGGGLLFLAGSAVLYFTRLTRPSGAADAVAVRTGHDEAWIAPVAGGFVAGVHGNL